MATGAASTGVISRPALPGVTARWMMALIGADGETKRGARQDGADQDAGIGGAGLGAGSRSILQPIG